MPLTLVGSDIAKTFNRRRIFEKVSFRIGFGETMLVTGRNGSGKSTLLRIICGVLSPTAGEVRLEGVPGERIQHLGLVAPYLQLFEEFTAAENLRLASSIRGRIPDEQAVQSLLGRIGLAHRRDEPVRGFSSGMKQRVKYAFALMHAPEVLLLDEPMANLDADGIQFVRSVMADQHARGILIVATNDMTDIGTFDVRIDLDEQR